MTPEMLSLKIFFSNDDIHRVRIEKEITYDGFLDFLNQQYPLQGFSESRIVYIDSDEDEIVVSSQREWLEMLNFFEIVNSVVKIYIKKNASPNLISNISTSTSNVVDKAPEIGLEILDQESMASRLPKCLALLSHDGKIIPGHFPSFLNDIIYVALLSSGEVDLKVDIPRLFDALDRISCELMDSQKLSDQLLSRRYMDALLFLSPRHYRITYNIACVEAIMGNVSTALHFLDQAVNLGFKDIELLTSDPDLKSIRNSGEYDNIVLVLADKLVNGSTDVPASNDLDMTQLSNYESESHVKEDDQVLGEDQMKKESNEEKVEEEEANQSESAPKINPLLVQSLASIQQSMQDIALAAQAAALSASQIAGDLRASYVAPRQSSGESNADYSIYIPPSTANSVANLSSRNE